MGLVISLMPRFSPRVAYHAPRHSLHTRHPRSLPPPCGGRRTKMARDQVGGRVGWPCASPTLRSGRRSVWRRAPRPKLCSSGLPSHPHYAGYSIAVPTTGLFVASSEETRVRLSGLALVTYVSARPAVAAVCLVRPIMLSCHPHARTALVTSSARRRCASSPPRRQHCTITGLSSRPPALVAAAARSYPPPCPRALPAEVPAHELTSS